MLNISLILSKSNANSKPSNKIGAFNNPRISLRARFIYMDQKKRAAGGRARGVVSIRSSIEQRACDLAAYIIENESTVRAAAARFGVSKSTVHKDITERLPAVNRGLYAEVRRLLDRNKAERHIRGGLATRRKYKGA